MTEHKAGNDATRLADAMATMRIRRDLDAYVIAANVSEGHEPSDWIIHSFRRREAALKRLRAARDSARHTPPEEGAS